MGLGSHEVKIAHLTDTYLPKIDGISTSVDLLAKSLIDLNLEVSVFSPKTPGDFNDPSFVHRFNSLSLVFQPEVRLSLPTPLDVLKRLLITDFSLVHSHAPGPLGILAEEIALIKGIPHIHTFHTLLADYTHYILEGRVVKPDLAKRASRFWCERCDLIVAPSKKMKSELLEYGVRKPIEIVPNGVNLNKFLNPSSDYFIKRGLVQPQDAVLIFVGRLGKEKSVDVLIEVFEQLLKRNAKKDIKLLLVGDGPFREVLQKDVNRRGLTGAVVFTGYIQPQDVPSALASSDIFVFASRTETQGVAVLEAIAAGLPVVVMRDAAFEGMVKDGANGFQVPNQESFVQALQFLIQDAFLRQQMGEKSKEMAQVFSASFLAAQMVSLYEKAQQELPVGQRRRRLLESTHEIVNKIKEISNREVTLPFRIV